MRLWRQKEGARRYPGASRLLVTCDAGGSNGHRCRLWKDELARFAAETGLRMSVCRFPPGTSKRNKTGHRLFCHSTRTWSAPPPMTADDAVAGIAVTITAQDLQRHPVRDDNDYPAAVEVSDRQVRHLEEHAVVRHGPHPGWNHTILPASAREQDPEPAGPDPALPAALAGIPDFGALLAGIDVAWQAGREHRLALARGHARVKNSGGPLMHVQLVVVPGDQAGWWTVLGDDGRVVWSRSSDGWRTRRRSSAPRTR